MANIVMLTLNETDSWTYLIGSASGDLHFMQHEMIACQYVVFMSSQYV